MDKNIVLDLAGNKIKCEKEVKFCIVIKCAACGKVKNVT
jgi:hypothetical protein